MSLCLLAVIYLAFISLGLPDSLLGAGWPTMQTALGVPLSYMGIVSMIISGGTICSSLFSERITRRFATKTVTAVSVLMTAIALFGFSVSSEFWMLCLWGIPYGLGAGSVDAALNNYIALHYKARHMSWLHCFWGVGTIISPYIMRYALFHSGWKQGYRLVGFIQLGIVMVLFLTLPLWKIHKKPGNSGKGHPLLGLFGAMKIPGVPALLFGFFAYCAAEATAMLWTSSYLAGVRGVTKEEAAAFGALFFIGITAGRFLSGLVSDKLGDIRMIYLGTAISFVGIACVFLPVKSDIFSIAGFIIYGFGCAPVYPSIIHATPAHFGKENSQAIIGIQMASAYVGSTFMPPVFGMLANYTGLRLMPFYLAFFMILLLLMIRLTEKQCRRRESSV